LRRRGCYLGLAVVRRRGQEDSRQLVPQLGWFATKAESIAQNAPEAIALVAPAAPSLDQEQFSAMSVDLDEVRQNIDRIAASIASIQEQVSRSADRGATEQIAHSVAQLAAGQEQMTREITKLQAVEQYVLYKNAEPAPRTAPAPVRKPVPQSTQAPAVR
jgi:methyl-accepting chemotaxis protein